jgi:hypothetical protein
VKICSDGYGAAGVEMPVTPRVRAERVMHYAVTRWGCY